MRGIGQEGAVSLVGAIVVPSGRLKALESAYARLRKTFEPEKDEVKGRKLNEQQVAKVIAFLASDDGDYMTGAIVSVDGGLTV